MKKYIIILFLFITQLSSRGQKSIPLKAPCTQEMCVNAKGKWIKTGCGFSSNINFSKIQQQEALKRMNEIEDLVFKMYPEPIGVDVVSGGTFGLGYFGSEGKYYVKNDKITFDYSKMVLTPKLKY